MYRYYSTPCVCLQVVLGVQVLQYSMCLSTGSTRCTGEPYLVLLHKVHVGGPLDLHGLALPVVQRQHEVEEVGLAEVGGRLLLVVGPGQPHAAGGGRLGLVYRCAELTDTHLLRL